MIEGYASRKLILDNNNKFEVIDLKDCIQCLSGECWE